MNIISEHDKQELIQEHNMWHVMNIITTNKKLIQQHNIWHAMNIITTYYKQWWRHIINILWTYEHSINFPPQLLQNTTTSHAYLRSDPDELVDCCSFSSLLLDISQNWQNYLPKYFCTSLEGVVVVLAAGYAWPRGWIRSLKAGLATNALRAPPS